MDPKKKHSVDQIVLIMLMVLYVLLIGFAGDERVRISLAPDQIPKFLEGSRNEDLIGYEFPVWAAVTAALSVFYLVKDRSVCHVICGILSLIPGICLPVGARIKTLAEVVTMPMGGLYSIEWVLTPMGYVQMILAWVILVFMVIRVILRRKINMKKQLAAASLTGNEVAS